MRQTARILALILLVAGLAGQYARAANLTVNCDRKETIHKAVKLLADSNPQGPNTITVSGSCRDNVLIQSMGRLTLITKKGASITDRSNGSSAVVAILDSQSVTVQGFTINGGFVGIGCYAASVCSLTGNTVEAAVIGLGVGSGSRAFLVSNVVQNSSFEGSDVEDGSQMFSSNDVFQDNAAQGITFGGGAYFVATNSSFLNNGGGILAAESNLRLQGVTISGSVGNGMTMRAGSTAVFQEGVTVTSNGGDGIHLEDASFAGFQSATVTGNLSGLDVNCAPQFTITHFVARTGGVTNCVESASPVR